jgi:cytochrome P450
MCRQVLADDVTFKFSYPKSTVEVLRYKLFWSFSRKEHMRFRRLISPLTMGYNNTLEIYPTRIEDIMINSLEEISSMSHPIEFLKELKNISFNIIIDIFMGSYNQHIITKIGNSFTDLHTALFSMPINLPGFAFRKGLMVSIS